MLSPQVLLGERTTQTRRKPELHRDPVKTGLAADAPPRIFYLLRECGRVVSRSLKGRRVLSSNVRRVKFARPRREPLPRQFERLWQQKKYVASRCIQYADDSGRARERMG
jgi:hypothetical protein